MSEHLEHLDETDLVLIDELADLKANDPEGYAAVLEDLTTGEVEASPDPEKAHAEWILETLSGASKRQQEGPLFSALNEAWRQAAREAAQEDSR